ncbi:peptidase domain-containing ABC transporter [Chitinophaga sp. sic0106]|uniref:peptidase domain-containing ABC transporter n=1 Tax=Chitinophaga sp. sic0106 TaxID=2854785 RepID=UPI001C448E50|nr:peptidase domain-containing ABC transporter [Chitinophaga sp. sic0106]MBV7529431.1 peptidase domain-containing ABC transporter [Chitinophaga sp. sic0106]
MLNKFPQYRQYDEMDCGPTCLRIVSKYYGKTYSIEYFRKLCHTTRSGSSLLAISEAAEKTGYRTIGAKLGYEDLAEEAPFPCLALWNQRHYVVVYKIRHNKVYVSDPAHGLITYKKEEFLKSWGAGVNNEGIILSMEPTPEFDTIGEEEKATNGGIMFIYKYLLKYKSLIAQLLVGLVAGSLLQLVFPFLTQSIVDTGIQHNNIGFIYMVLLAQLLLFFGKTSVEVLRGFILMHLSSRININLLSDFFRKLMKLPLGYFDVKMTGDILQRITDHQRVELFLTSGTLNTVFSFINLIIFTVVLVIYSPLIFAVFASMSACYFIWVTFFMKKRATLDYKRFTQLSQNNEKNLELIYGMQEIKLNNAERKKRWQWEHLQVKLFKTSLKGLQLSQAQTSGASLINELKNIIITFLAAKLVIDGKITLGVMLSISYIIGQLNGPILQLVEFLKSWQDARLSIGRINEIHNKPDEESETEEKIQEVPSGDITISNLTFQYESTSRSKPVLKNLDLLIPHQKVTAIVGASGSGKSTLLKLLLKFYDPQEGGVYVGGHALADISHAKWRASCGVVMQEGYIFNDSIAGNVAVGEQTIDNKRLFEACRIANIHEYIDTLPLKYNTKIGQNGMGLSTGQKQRILIARAVYKNPAILFFDEATSALDARNERVIIENLNRFFEGRTVVVIAHRLSTVKSADKIIVLEKGQITEAGTHQELIQEQGYYFNLVRNQLELGN